VQINCRVVANVAVVADVAVAASSGAGLIARGDFSDPTIDFS